MPPYLRRSLWIGLVFLRIERSRQAQRESYKLYGTIRAHAINRCMCSLIDKLPEPSKKVVLLRGNPSSVQHQGTKHHWHLPNCCCNFEMAVLRHSNQRCFDLLPSLQNRRSGTYCCQSY